MFPGEPAPKKIRLSNFEPDEGPSNYIERECAPIEDVAEIMLDTSSPRASPVFLGPKGCGKSSTLCQVWHHLRDKSHLVFLIDLKSVTVTMVEGLDLQDNFYVLVDNAQMLAKNDDVARVVRGLARRAKGACFAFSPVIVDAHGDSIYSAEIKNPHHFYFTPFTSSELEEYFKKNQITTNNNISSFIKNYSANIPSLVVSIRPAHFSKKDEFDVESHIDSLMYRTINDQLNSIRNALLSPSDQQQNRAVELQTALFQAVAFGCEYLHKVSLNKLVYAGFCYQKSRQVFLAYPNKQIFDCLTSYIKTIVNFLSTFNTGATLEFLFYLRAKTKGFHLESPLSKDPITIPSVDNVFVQHSIGVIPDSFITDSGTSTCLVVKLAQNHVAIDFLIVTNGPAGGIDSRKLYFVQVSLQRYEDRNSESKLAAISTTYTQLDGKSPISVYSHLFNTHKKNCYYVYASSAKSSFSSIKSTDKFYSLHLSI